MDITKKSKYIEIYKKEKEEYYNKLEKLNNYIFDIPKRPKSVFILYLEDQYKINNIIKLFGYI